MSIRCGATRRQAALTSLEPVSLSLSTALLTLHGCLHLTPLQSKPHWNGQAPLEAASTHPLKFPQSAEAWDPSPAKAAPPHSARAELTRGTVTRLETESPTSSSLRKSELRLAASH